MHWSLTMNKICFYACVFFGYAISAENYFRVGLPFMAFVIALLGFAWMMAQWRVWLWSDTPGLLIIVTANIIGSWNQFSSLVLIFSTVFGIIAWDLSRFHLFIQRAAKNDNLISVQRRHYINILFFFLIAITTSYGSVIIRFQPGFVLATFLMVIAFIAILQLSRWLLIH